MYKFSLCNQVFLNLDTSNAVHDSIWVVYIIWDILALIVYKKHV